MADDGGRRVGSVKDTISSVFQEKTSTWKKYRSLAIATGLGASLVGGGIPTIILMGVCLTSAGAGIHRYVETRKFHRELGDIEDKLMIENAFNNDLDSKIIRADRKNLEGELTCLMESKQHID